MGGGAGWVVVTEEESVVRCTGACGGLRLNGEESAGWRTEVACTDTAPAEPYTRSRHGALRQRIQPGRVHQAEDRDGDAVYQLVGATPGGGGNGFNLVASTRQQTGMEARFISS